MMSQSDNNLDRQIVSLTPLVGESEYAQEVIREITAVDPIRLEASEVLKAELAAAMTVEDEKAAYARYDEAVESLRLPPEGELVIESEFFNLAPMAQAALGKRYLPVIAVEA